MRTQRVKKIEKKVADISFIVVVGFICFILLCTARGERPNFLGFEVHKVETSKMEPLIQKNECIIIKHIDKGDIQIGDIITFLSKDKDNYGVYDTSRVVDIFESKGTTWYTTKSDEADSKLIHVSYEDVEGKYCSNLICGKIIGNCVEILEGNNIYLLVIMSPFIIFIIGYAFGIFKKIYGQNTNTPNSVEDDTEEEEECEDNYDEDEIEEVTYAEEKVYDKDVESQKVDIEEIEIETVSDKSDTNQEQQEEQDLEDLYEEDEYQEEDNESNDYDELSEVRSEISETMLRLEQMRVEAREKRKQAEKFRAEALSTKNIVIDKDDSKERIETETES